MSRVDQSVGSDLQKNPTSRFFQFKNYFTMEEITVKGKTKEVKVFDKAGFIWSTKNEDDGYDTHDFDLPIEFALLNGDWVNFKGWNADEKVFYKSTEVKDADSVISVSNKDGIVYEFTLNQMWGKVKGSSVKDEEGSKAVKAKLKQLGVKQHSSVYAAIRKDDGFELVNFQLKGANLSGSREKENQPSGWWNVSKEFKKSKKIYTHWIQMNDWITESGELGEYGVVNFTLGDKIDAEDNEKIEVLFEELEAYHKYYLNKGKEAEPVVEAIEEDPSAIYNENGEKLF
jgi:hypothetical protein